VLQSGATSVEFDLGTTFLNDQDETVKTDYSRLNGTPFSRGAVASKRAVVVGAGALGNEVVKALGLLGVDKVLIVDPDVVEPSNLTRSVLFRTPRAAGRNKALVLAEASSGHFPDTAWRALGCEFADVGFEEIAAADLVFSCVDNEMTRLEIAYAATKLDRPVCDGGLAAADTARGRVSFFPGRKTACYSCQLRSQTRRELLTQWESPRYSCWGDPADQGSALSSTPTMAAVIGSMQVEIGLKQLLNRQTQQASGSFSIDVSLSTPVRMESIELRRSPACPFHETSGSLLVSAPVDAPFSAILASAEAPWAEARPVVLLDWPICTRAGCDDCGRRWQPLRRASALRRTGLCPGCRSRYVREHETIRRIDADSPWASYTPAQLGIPARHLHTIAFEQGNAA